MRLSKRDQNKLRALTRKLVMVPFGSAAYFRLIKASEDLVKTARAARR